jgi:hypothetical protein
MINKVLISDKYFIKVNSETVTSFIGFDILTENVVSIDKTEKYMEISQSVLDLIGSEELRFRVVNTLCSSDLKRSKLLKVTERTVFRMKNQYTANVIPRK